MFSLAFYDNSACHCKGFAQSGVCNSVCQFDPLLLDLTSNVTATHTHCGALDVPNYMHTRTLAWNNDTRLRCEFKRYAGSPTIEITITDSRGDRFEKTQYYGFDEAMSLLQKKLSP